MLSKKKDSVSVNCNLDVVVNNMITEIADETDLTKTAIIERAIKEYYEKYKKTGKI